MNKEKQGNNGNIIQIAPKKKSSNSSNVVIERASNQVEKLHHSASKTSK